MKNHVALYLDSHYLSVAGAMALEALRPQSLMAASVEQRQSESLAINVNQIGTLLAAICPNLAI